MQAVAEPTARQLSRRKYEASRPKRTGQRHKEGSEYGNFRAANPLEVVFIDGEGNKQPDEVLFDNSNGTQTVGKEDRYWIIQASNGDTLRCPRGERLSTAQIFEFLFNLKKPRRHLVCYGMGYDLTHWLRDLGDEAYRECRSEEGISWKTPEWAYKVRRFGLKILSVTRWSRIDPSQKGARITISDCLSGFGGTFTKALTDWHIGTPSEMAILERMKALRGDFASVPEEEIVAYNELECRLGAALMRAYVDAVVEAVGTEPTGFHGAGALAGLMLKYRGVGALVVRHRGEMPAAVTDLMQRAFIGGQFQSLQIGHIGPVSNADYCAAYPSGIARLPAPGGSWGREREYRMGAEHGLWKLRWDTRGTTEPFTPFPWREHDGGIHYAPVGQGWYHCCEVDAAIQIWGKKIVVYEGWIYTPPVENPHPFEEWMKGDFARRKEWGKTGKGLVLKLGNNSCYGKFAEKQIGMEIPPYKLPFYAGEITARTRAAIKEFAAPIWDRVVGVQCDGVLFTGEWPDAPYRKELGQMETPDRYEDCWMFQPGLGFLTKGGKVTTKARGVAEKALDLSQVSEVWAEHQVMGQIELPGRERFISRDLAIHQGRGERAYHWVTEGKTIQTRPGRGDYRLIEAMPNGQSYRWHSYDVGRNYDKLSASYKTTRSETMELAHLREAMLLETDE